MKSLKKTLVLLVVLSMLVSAISPVFATTFNDEIPEAYWERANKLAAIGVIAGDQNGNFNATSNITRAEMAVIICKMAGINEATANASKSIPSIFEDVPANEWYTGWINLAVDNGMIAGFPDGTFRPNDPLTTNQAITLVVKALGKGVYVDKMGTWPGNYVQEAAKLGLTNDMVDTGSDLANRGNVAILAWEALQVGTWDVVETSLESGEVTLSESESLIIKYFKDFVAGKGRNADPYRVKLVEDAVVTKSGKTTSDLGANQIVLKVADDGKTRFNGERTVGFDDSIADYIDAQPKPKKTAKTSTYEGTDPDDVVAYVPADVSDLNNIVNKKVNVLFGADNAVALIYVTEDTVDDAYVTSWNDGTKKITIADTEYKVNNDAVVSVFNHELAGNDTAIEKITTIITDVLGVAKPSKTFNRALKADIVLDANDKIEKINFTFGEEVANAINTVDGALKVEQGIVKTITKAGVVRKLDGSSFFGGAEVEDLDDDDDTRVIKDDEVVTFADIEAGDVVTAISVANEWTLVYISTEKAEGEVSEIKDDMLTTDSDTLSVVKTPVMNLDGEFEEAEKVTTLDDLDDLVGEEAEFYLNFVGEVVGAIASSDATGTSLGVVTGNASLKEDDDGVEYLSVRILTEDGTKASYKVYNKRSGKDVTDATTANDSNVAFDDDCLVKGNLIQFTADANRKIKSDKIHQMVPTDDGEEFSFASNSGVTAHFVEQLQANDPSADEDKKRFVIGADTYNWKDSTIAFNTKDNKTEVVKDGWKAIVNSEDELADMAKIWVFEKSNKIIYFAAAFNAYQASDAMYGIRMDNGKLTTKNEDGDTVSKIILFTDGEEHEYEITKQLSNTIEKYDFVTYTVTDDEIETIVPLINDAVDFVDAEDDDKVAPAFAKIVTNVSMFVADTAKAQFEVDEAEFGDKTGSITYVDDATYIDANNVEQDYAQLALVDLDEDVVIYDLSKPESPAMISTDAIKDIEGRYAVCFKGEADTEATIVVVF